jgi:hypothetical protein
VGVGGYFFFQFLGEEIGKINAIAKSTDNLQRIGLAMLDYNDEHGRLPPAVVYNKNGKPLYSWRVLLLPYLGENGLYSQFHLNEAWDSPHNRTLLARMPDVYAHPKDASRTETHYQVFDGPHATYNTREKNLVPFRLLPKSKGRFLENGNACRIPNSFEDEYNTILVAEATEPVPWSKPRDLPFDYNGPLPRLGGLYSGDKLVVVMANGAPRVIDRDYVSDIQLRPYITPAYEDRIAVTR